MDDVPYVPIGHRVDTSDSSASTTRDFNLKRGVWATGRVFDAETDKPFTGQLEYFYFQNAELEESGWTGPSGQTSSRAGWSASSLLSPGQGRAGGQPCRSRLAAQ